MRKKRKNDVCWIGGEAVICSDLPAEVTQPFDLCVPKRNKRSYSNPVFFRADLLWITEKWLFRAGFC